MYYHRLRLSKNPTLHQAKIGFFFVFIKITIKSSNLEGVFFLFHFHFASFFKFMVANLSLTQFVTCARPVYGVYLIACFSFASANTLSIFSFRSLYKSAYLGVFIAHIILFVLDYMSYMYNNCIIIKRGE